MNSVVKLLFYKTYEDRVSKLKVITIIWFILCFVFFLMNGNIIYAFFAAIMMAIPVFSIGLIIRILFIDKEEAVVTEVSSEVEGE